MPGLGILWRELKNTRRIVLKWSVNPVMTRPLARCCAVGACDARESSGSMYPLKPNSEMSCSDQISLARAGFRRCHGDFEQVADLGSSMHGRPQPTERRIPTAVISIACGRLRSSSFPVHLRFAAQRSAPWADVSKLAGFSGAGDLGDHEDIHF